MPSRSVQYWNIFFPHSLVTGGQVSRVDPDSAGLNPVWRNSLAFVALSTSWQEGANLTEIEAARHLLVQDMKILDGIAPESGSSSNQVRILGTLYPISTSFSPPRPRDMNLTGKNLSMAHTTTDSEQ